MDWAAGLPVDMLIEFAVRLTGINWLKFGAVCTAWKRAAEAALASGRHPKPEPPWLMLAGSSTDLTTANFFSFSDGRGRTATLPEPAIQSRVWIGSAHGWLVTADEEYCTLHLLNPSTGAQLPLPSITTMGFFELLPRTATKDTIRFLFHARSFLAVHWPEDNVFLEYQKQSDEIPVNLMPLLFLRKAVPLHDPSSGDYLVMMIHGPQSTLVFARQSDAKWVILPSSYTFDDVIPYKGQFYAVTRCGTVLIWEPDGETFKPRIAVPEHNEGDEYVCFKKYLAESLDGDLVLIWREYWSCYGEDSDNSATNDDNDDDNCFNLGYPSKLKPDPTVMFHVFVLRENKWKKLDNLNGAALFIGCNSAVFFLADDIPYLLADCIYFVDDNLGRSWCRKQATRDMGIFNMKSKVVKPMPSLVRQSKSWPPPVWITPSICTQT